MKDHEKRELVNALTAIAKQYGQAQQLRARIAHCVLDAIEQAVAEEREACAKVCKDLAEAARKQKQYVRADHYSVCESHIHERSNAVIQGPRSGPAGMEG